MLVEQRWIPDETVDQVLLSREADAREHPLFASELRRMVRNTLLEMGYTVAEFRQFVLEAYQMADEAEEFANL